MINSDTNLSITYLATANLVPFANNARTHSKKQIGLIADSIKTFGFINPVIIDRDNVIIAGHGKFAAANKLNLSLVPTIRIEHLTEDQKRAYILADNKLAELSGWDQSILAIELQHIITIKTEFDVTITGFERPEIDFIIQGAVPEKDKEEDFEVNEIDPIVTRQEDLWILGDHFILCGDALVEANYLILMNDEKAQLVFTDPPYNLPIHGHVSGLGKAAHEEFAMASGEMSPEDFTLFLNKTFKLLGQHSVDGSIHFIFMDWRHGLEIMTAARGVYPELKNICVWNKSNGGMGSLYRSKHEFIYVFKRGEAPHINNVELGKHGRYRSNVWDYAGQTSMHADRGAELAMHPTLKPTSLVADAILDCSHRGGVVLDPFGGGGTTLLAAEKTGRKARLMEVEPKFVDITVRRWQKLTGRQAKNYFTEELFDEREKAVGGNNV